MGEKGRGDRQKTKKKTPQKKKKKKRSFLKALARGEKTERRKSKSLRRKVWYRNPGDHRETSSAWHVEKRS